MCVGGTRTSVSTPTSSRLFNARGADGVTRGIRCRLVDLFEYQARDVLASHGVPVLPGGVAETPEQAERIASDIGERVVVKAQVKTGGRGKGGGGQLAGKPADARPGAQETPGLDIKGPI